MFERSLEEKNIRPRILRFSSVRGLLACLKRGLGFTVCPAVSVEEDLNAGRLFQLAGDGNEEVSLIMIWHAEKWRSPLLTRFMKVSEEVMGEAAGK